MHNDGELFVKNTDFQNPKTQRKISQKEKKNRCIRDSPIQKMIMK